MNDKVNAYLDNILSNFQCAIRKDTVLRTVLPVVHDRENKKN